MRSRRTPPRWNRNRPTKKSEHWRARTLSDLYVCKLMGWTYDELLDLPVDVYDVLIDTLQQEAAKAKK